jgi:hypothetical protein
MGQKPLSGHVLFLCNSREKYTERQDVCNEFIKGKSNL